MAVEHRTPKVKLGVAAARKRGTRRNDGGRHRDMAQKLFLPRVQRDNDGVVVRIGDVQRKVFVENRHERLEPHARARRRRLAGHVHAGVHVGALQQHVLRLDHLAHGAAHRRAKAQRRRRPRRVERIEKADSDQQRTALFVGHRLRRAGRRTAAQCKDQSCAVQGPIVRSDKAQSCAVKTPNRAQ